MTEIDPKNGLLELISSVSGIAKELNLAYNKYGEEQGDSGLEENAENFIDQLQDIYNSLRHWKATVSNFYYAEDLALQQEQSELIKSIREQQKRLRAVQEKLLR